MTFVRGAEPRRALDLKGGKRNFAVPVTNGRDAQEADVRSRDQYSR